MDSKHLWLQLLRELKMSMLKSNYCPFKKKKSSYNCRKKDKLQWLKLVPSSPTKQKLVPTLPDYPPSELLISLATQIYFYCKRNLWQSRRTCALHNLSKVKMNSENPYIIVIINEDDAIQEK